MAPYFRYTGSETKIFADLKNRNGTTVKAEPDKVFDLVSAPKDHPEFVQVSEAEAKDVATPKETPTASPTPQEQVDAILAEAKAQAEKVLADADEIEDEKEREAATLEAETTAAQILEDAAAKAKAILNPTS